VEAVRAWYDLNAESAPQSALSYLTVNGPVVDLRSDDFRERALELKKRARACFARFPAVRFYGQVEIAVLPDLEAGKLHFSGWLRHDQHALEEIELAFRSTFTEPRDVSLLPMRTGNRRKNFDQAARYSAKMYMRNISDVELPVLVSLINAYEQIRSRGRMGLRFTYGCRRKRKGQKRETRTIPVPVSQQAVG
jgi:hypothetical protein